MLKQIWHTIKCRFRGHPFETYGTHYELSPMECTGCLSSSVHTIMVVKCSNCKAIIGRVEMAPEEYNIRWQERLGTVEGLEPLKEVIFVTNKSSNNRSYIWFMPEDLESYIKERSYKKSWDDSTDWVNGMSFRYRGYLPDNNAEAKFRLQVAVYLIDLIRRIEWNEI